MAQFDKQAQTWKCTICNYTREKRQLYQVFGHIAASHGYESRVPNERRDILIIEKYINQTLRHQSINLKKARHADMQNERVGIYTSYGRNFWERGYCERNFDIENERCVSTHRQNAWGNQNNEPTISIMPSLLREHSQSKAPHP